MKLRRFTLLSSLLTLILLFQNCSRSGIAVQDFLSGSAKLASETDSSGNGTGYGGKLTTTYYHYVPGYQCEKHSSAFASIEFDPNAEKSVLLQSRDSQCLSVQSSIPNSNLDLGSLQNKVLGYEEKIFESGATASSVAPSNPVEIWCVNQWSEPQIEILSTYDQADKQARTEFYYPNQAKRVENNPARSTQLQSVHLASEYFDLVINKSLKGTKAGTFLGQLKLKGSDSEQTLQCRLGGYLDARLWPAKAMNYDNFMQAEWSPADRLFYIISGLSGAAPYAENTLYSYSPDTSAKQALVNNTSGTRGVDQFQFTPDRSKLILRAQTSSDASVQLYSLGLGSPTPQTPVRLNNLLTDIGQGVSDGVTVSPDASLIYYMDGAQEVGGDIEDWLRVVDTKTGVISQVNQPLSLGGDIFVGQFDVSFSLGKVVYSTGNIYHEIWISDLFGGNRHKIDLSSLLGSKYILEWYMKRGSHWRLIQDRYLVLVATPPSALMSTLSIAIDLSTETVTSKELMGFSYVFPVKGLPAVGFQVYSTATGPTGPSTTYLNLLNGKYESISDLINDFQSSSNPQQVQAAAELSMTQATSLCGSTESLVRQIQLDSQNWLILKKASDTVLSLYLTSTGSPSCQSINKLSLPSTEMAAVLASHITSPAGPFFYIDPLKAGISPDRKNVLLAVSGRLFLVPADQHPVIEIYTALNAQGAFDEIGFTDSSKVFFKGSLIKDFWRQIFIWNIPSY